MVFRNLDEASLSMKIKPAVAHMNPMHQLILNKYGGGRGSHSIEGGFLGCDLTYPPMCRPNQIEELIFYLTFRSPPVLMRAIY